MITVDEALDALHALGSAEKAAEALAYHKVDRPYLGVKVPQIEELTDQWRADCSLEERLDLAADLWESNIHEARVAAAKLLVQARIRPDDTAAWELISAWVPQFDAWSIADHVAIAGQKRLVADPSRIEDIEEWTESENMWQRRAALVMTLPFAKQNFPKPFELDIRDRVLGWCAYYAEDKDWFIQKAVAWWLRDLSKHDVPRVKGFLAMHGDTMKTWARKEAMQYLPADPVKPEATAASEPAAPDATE